MQASIEPPDYRAAVTVNGDEVTMQNAIVFFPSNIAMEYRVNGDSAKCRFDNVHFIGSRPPWWNLYRWWEIVRTISSRIPVATRYEPVAFNG